MSPGNEHVTGSAVPEPNPDPGIGLVTALEQARHQQRDNQEQPGQFVGPYKLLSILGEGGFGVVWLAERREPIVQTVALKIIKAGMDTKMVVARFEQERQALAVMNHPHVAKVYDAGTAPSGRAYFAMEHVKGEPITNFCDIHGYTIRQRLQLFIPVCQAVQHAHLNGIIHRDIKPSNILISIVDGLAVPKVIDFGVAKATRHTLTQHTIFTESGQLIGTPEYMSPEQAEMGALDVDARTDVYSLGVVLYELLTTALPFDSAKLRSMAYAEIQRFIREVEPPTPSKKLTSLGAEADARIARTHHARREAIVEQLRRELEWIPLMAMRKDRTRRYETPGLLAEDIQFYLRGQPLRAAPESRTYILWKFVRRNRTPVAAAAVLVAALMLGLAGTLWQARAATIARVRAETIRDFVVSALRAGDPSEGGRFETTIAEAVRTASNRLPSTGPSQDPATQADLRIEIAQILLHNGDPHQALVNLEQALQATRTLHAGDDHAEVARVLTLQGEALMALGSEAEAEQHLRRACDIYRAAGQDRSEGMADAQSDLGTLLTSLDRCDEAEPLLVQALKATRSVHPGDYESTIDALNGLGETRRRLGRRGEAERDFSEALEMSLRLHKGDHPSTALCLNNVAAVLFELGRREQAEKQLQEALAMYRRLYPKGHPRFARCLCNTGMVLASVGLPDQGEKLLREALGVQDAVFQGDHADMAQALNNLGCLLQSSNRSVEAEPLLARALDMRRRLFAGDRLPVAQSLKNLAVARMSLGRCGDAEPLLVEARDMGMRMSPAGRYDLADIVLNLSLCRLCLDKPQQAESDAQEAGDLLGRLYPGGHAYAVRALCAVALALHKQGKQAQAIESWQRAADMAARVETLPGGIAQEVAATRVRLEDKGRP